MGSLVGYWEIEGFLYSAPRRCEAAGFFFDPVDKKRNPAAAPRRGAQW
jgi:hypothetical protein